VGVVDGMTGEIRPAQIFVAVLGASNYTYAEATWSQGLADWIGSCPFGPWHSLVVFLNYWCRII